MEQEDFANVTVLPERITNRIKVDREGCWTWIGAKRYGVGVTTWQDRSQPVHRIVYEQFHGDIPPRGQVIRTCGCLSCVRPNHLALRMPAAMGAEGGHI